MQVFSPFLVFLQRFIYFEYFFLVILGDFLTFWENYENPRWRIQDGACFDIMM